MTKSCGSGNLAGRPALRGPIPLTVGDNTNQLAGGEPRVHMVIAPRAAAHWMSPKTILWPTGSAFAGLPAGPVNCGLDV